MIENDDGEISSILVEDEDIDRLVAYFKMREYTINQGFALMSTIMRAMMAAHNVNGNLAQNEVKRLAQGFNEYALELIEKERSKN